MSSSKDTSDLIVGQSRLITGVRDRTVEEEVLIDGVRDDDDEDKLSTMTTAGASSPVTAMAPRPLPGRER